jgi:hypothetical protein
MRMEEETMRTWTRKYGPAPLCGAVVAAAVVATVTACAGDTGAQRTEDTTRAQPTAAQATTSQAPRRARSSEPIDPKAIAALRSMGAYLRTLKQFRVKADGARDEVTASGQKIQVSGTVAYTVRTPNRLRAEIRTDRKQREIFYDGRTLTVYAPRMRYYANAPAPPTIREMLDSVSRQHGIEVPLADLFLWGTPRDGVEDLKQARYIGPAFVNGLDTDQYAFRQEGVDWQLWLDRSDRPLPRRLVITTTSEPSEPQYAAILTWDLLTPVNEEVFAFVPASNAVKIRLASMVPARAVASRTAKK